MAIQRALAERLLATKFSAEIINAHCSAIVDESRRAAPWLAEPNFTQIQPSDLRRMYDLYDELFFGGVLHRELARLGQPLTFDFAPRMTSAGGKTYRHKTWHSSPGGRTLRTRYEIKISSTLLFQTFADVPRPILVNGLTCRHRLDALQRIFEHELLHLAELLIFDDSNCSAKQFRLLAHNHFGHRDTVHDLVTQRERAMENFGIRQGDRVMFDYEGERLTGVVNRITRRATILVEHRTGQEYSDGKRYLKFYIPLPLLQRVAS